MNITSTTIVPNTTTTPYAPILPSNDKCNYYIVNQTSIAWLDFGNPYGGIPQNLLINSVSKFISHHICKLAISISTTLGFQIGFLVLLLLFAIFRRTAGNYGRLALIRKDDDESGWAQIFYSQRQADENREEEEDDATFEGADLIERSILILMLNHFQEDL